MVAAAALNYGSHHCTIVALPVLESWQPCLFMTHMIKNNIKHVNCGYKVRVNLTLFGLFSAKIFQRIDLRKAPFAYVKLSVYDKYMNKCL